MEEILSMAEVATSGRDDAVGHLTEGLSAADSAVRYWAAIGLLARGSEAVNTAYGPLKVALRDHSPSVRVMAAEAISNYGHPSDLRECLEVLIEAADYRNTDVYVATLAMNVIDQLDEKARPLMPRVRNVPVEIKGYPGRASGYADRLVKTTLEDLE